MAPWRSILPPALRQALALILSRGPLSAAKPCTNFATCGPAAAAFSPIAIHIGVVIAAIETGAAVPANNPSRIKSAAN